MKLVKTSTIAIVLFIITTGAIIIKNPQTEERELAVSETTYTEPQSFNMKSVPVRQKSRLHSIVKK